MRKQRKVLVGQEKTVDELISEECLTLERMLLLKNSAYNNSLHTEPPLFPIDSALEEESVDEDRRNSVNDSVRRRSVRLFTRRGDRRRSKYIQVTNSRKREFECRCR